MCRGAQALSCGAPHSLPPMAHKYNEAGELYHVHAAAAHAEQAGLVMVPEADMLPVPCRWPLGCSRVCSAQLDAMRPTCLASAQPPECRQAPLCCLTLWRWQARLPGPEWRERYGAAGVPAGERRSSPIVEISLLLVRWCLHHHSSCS